MSGGAAERCGPVRRHLTRSADRTAVSTTWSRRATRSVAAVANPCGYRWVSRMTTTSADRSVNRSVTWRFLRRALTRQFTGPQRIARNVRADVRELHAQSVVTGEVGADPVDVTRREAVVWPVARPPGKPSRRPRQRSPTPSEEGTGWLRGRAPGRDSDPIAGSDLQLGASVAAPGSNTASTPSRVRLLRRSEGRRRQSDSGADRELCGLRIRRGEPMVGRVGPIWWPHREVRRWRRGSRPTMPQTRQVASTREHCAVPGRLPRR